MLQISNRLNQIHKLFSLSIILKLHRMLIHNLSQIIQILIHRLTIKPLQNPVNFLKPLLRILNQFQISTFTNLLSLIIIIRLIHIQLQPSSLLQQLARTLRLKIQLLKPFRNLHNLRLKNHNRFSKIFL